MTESASGEISPPEGKQQFDYVYHLPHADLTRLGARRDPFADPPSMPVISALPLILQDKPFQVWRN